PCADTAVLPGADRRRSVRADLHARRQDLLPRRPASRRGQGLDLRGSIHALARLQGRHAAPAGGGGDYQEGWRDDRLLTPEVSATDPVGSSRREGFRCVWPALCMPAAGPTAVRHPYFAQWRALRQRRRNRIRFLTECGGG